MVGARWAGSRSVVGAEPGPRAKNLPGNTPTLDCGTFLKPFSPHVPPLLFHVNTGNIESFKDMPLTSLNLYNCEKLTGEWCVSWVGMGGWGQDQ